MILLPPCPATFRKTQDLEKRLSMIVWCQTQKSFCYTPKVAQDRPLSLTDRKVCKMGEAVTIREYLMGQGAQVWKTGNITNNLERGYDIQ